MSTTTVELRTDSVNTMDELVDIYQDFDFAIEEALGKSRYASLAKTAAEQALVWAITGLGHIHDDEGDSE